MPIKSQQLGPGSLKIGETGTDREWAAQLTKMELTPDVEEGDVIPVLSGEEITEEDVETFTLGGSLLQDYEAGSLELMAWAARGTWVPFTFTPNTEAGTQWTGECKMRAIKIGGDVKKRNQSDFEFPARNVSPVAGGAGFMAAFSAPESDADEEPGAGSEAGTDYPFAGASS